MQAEPPSNRSDEANIAAMRQLVEQFTAAYNSGDAPKIASLFTKEALLMPPEEPTIVGNESVEARFEVFFDGFSFDMDLFPRETYMLGELGFERGIYAAFSVPKEGGVAAGGYGEYMFLFEENHSGDWKISAFGTDIAESTTDLLERARSANGEWSYKWTGTMTSHFGNTVPSALLKRLAK